MWCYSLNGGISDLNYVGFTNKVLLDYIIFFLDFADLHSLSMHKY